VTKLDENDWQTILAAVENLRGGGTEPHDTDTRWRIASSLADIASRLRAELDEEREQLKRDS
jgi:hypothetical protein